MAKRKETEYIVVHCSATRAGRDYDPDQLQRDHMARGFHSAGYHFYVRKSGYVHPFRPLEMIGAHAFGYNGKSIGVCYEGGLDDSGKAADTRTPQQKESLLRLLSELRSIYPKAKIVGHRYLSPDLNNDGKITSNEWTKLCPCFDANTEYQDI